MADVQEQQVDLPEAAFELAEAGFRVFPLCPRGKTPLKGGWAKDATDDPVEVRDLWTVQRQEKPTRHANIGCATGKRVMLDFDTDEALETFKEIAKQQGGFPRTVAARSGRSNAEGLHIWYELPDDIDESIRIKTDASVTICGVKIKDFDVRGHGGLAVLPPSVHPSGNRYEWLEGFSPWDISVAAMPKWMINELRAAYDHEPGDPGVWAGECPVDDERHEELASAVQAIDADCDRTRWRNVGMALHSEYNGHETGFLLWDSWSATAAERYPGTEEARKQWGSYRIREGQTINIETVFQYAKEDSGWRWKPKAPTETIALDSGTEITVPTVMVEVGELGSAIEQAEAALIESWAQERGVERIYQRGSALARVRYDREPVSIRRGVSCPDEAPVIERVAPVYLQRVLEDAARFYRPDRKGKPVRTCCPQPVIQGYMQSAGHWQLPHLQAVTTTPVFRRDGTILQTPGYDLESGVYYDPCGVDYPVIPDAPNEEDALEALGEIMHVVRAFPWKQRSDLSVWLAALLTPFVRPMLPSAPLFLFTAPVRGSGKSKLVNIIAAVATGTSPSVMAHATDPDEQRKRILALLMRGVPVVCIDNVETAIGGSTLCSILTEPTFEDRVLGETRTVKVPTAITVTVTGNNVSVTGDLTRRVLACTIDPKLEHPENRSFDFEPVDLALRNRPALVAACLTILRGYIAAGMPSPDSGPLHPFGSFEQWSEIVRGAVCWLGEPDPIEGRSGVAEADEAQELVSVFLESWHRLHAERPITVARALEEQELRDIAEELTEESGDDRKRLARAVGMVLRREKQRVFAGRCFVEEGSRQGIKLWSARIVGG